jgi:hypothetical protein
VYTQTLKEAGAPDFIAAYMIPVYALISDNKVTMLSDDVERVTGKKPTPLRLYWKKILQVLQKSIIHWQTVKMSIYTIGKR